MPDAVREQEVARYEGNISVKNRQAFSWGSGSGALGLNSHLVGAAAGRKRGRESHQRRCEHETVQAPYGSSWFIL
jgi:hypothetical protein